LHWRSLASALNSPAARTAGLRDYLKKWFDKPVLSKAEGLTTNGEGSLCPFVLSLSKDRLFCKDGFEIVSKSPQRPLQRGISTLAGLLTTFKEQLMA
jgi:hypothetical protein